MDQSAADLATAAELRGVVGKLSRRLREEANPGDFTWSQTAAFIRLERDGPMTLTELARAEGMRPQSMGAIVAVFEAAGFVHGSPHPTDGRQTLLAVTQKAHESITAGRAAKEDWLFRSMRTSLSADERRRLTEAIGLLARLLEP